MTDFEFPRSVLSLVDNELVPVGITKLCHPANRRFGFGHIESNAARFKFLNRGVDVIYLKGNRRSVPRWLPGRMTTNTNGGWAKVVLDPPSLRLRSGRFQLERFLIKLSRAFLVRNSDGNKCDFFNNKQGSFSFSGFNL